MNLNKDLAIGVLSVTAVVLFVGVVLMQTRAEPAYASGMTATGGDYVVSIGMVQRSSPDDLLYIIDAVEKKLIVYSCNVARKEITMTDTVDLEKLAEATARTTPTAPMPRGPAPPQRGRPRP